MSTQNNYNSFTSSDGFPFKLLSNPEMMNELFHHSIKPYYPQLCPTNRCNQHCSFCAFGNIPHSEELSIERIIPMIHEFKKLGMLAVGIAGGGEPLLHKHIEEIIAEFIKEKIEIGLTTNGTLFHVLEKRNHNDLHYFNNIVWIRISRGDGQSVADEYFEHILTFAQHYPRPVYGFSYVLTKGPEFKKVEKIVNFINLHKDIFKYLRVVSDSLNNIGNGMEELRKYLHDQKIDDSLVIYQSRNEPSIGGECFIGYAKPVIAANGGIYRCCAVGAAIPSNPNTFPDELKMGTIDNISAALAITKESVRQGFQCKKCYYAIYNIVLKNLYHADQIFHKNFI